jgi:energy-coupling factor transport system permease protein
MLFSEADRLKKALKVRGVKFGGSLKSRLRYWRWLILPLMVNSVRQAEELALAMEMRGFGVSPFFTFEKGKLSWRDGLAVFLAALGILALLRLVR